MENANEILRMLDECDTELCMALSCTIIDYVAVRMGISSLDYIKMIMPVIKAVYEEEGALGV